MAGFLKLLVLVFFGGGNIKISYSCFLATKIIHAHYITFRKISVSNNLTLIFIEHSYVPGTVLNALD